MIPLAVRLDDTDFDRLVALARGQLPARTPRWTDFNIHDPGIMLVELLAWLADTQIYSLARDRADERKAMLGLMQRRTRGAVPAAGMVYPATAPNVAQPVLVGAVLRPARGGAPRVESDADITLLPVSVERVAVQSPDGSLTDVTGTIVRARAAFDAFGASGAGSLRIELKADAPIAGTEPVLLSLGFFIEDGASEARDERLGRVGAWRADGTPVERARDSTFDLQRSGAMLFRIDPARIADPIVLRPEAGYALAPRLLSIVPNALPVAQRATFRLTEWNGTGRPGQTLLIQPQQLFPSDEASEGRLWRLVDGPGALAVQGLSGGSFEAWEQGRLDDAGPEDRSYLFDEASDGSRIRIRFGNGINGRRPGLSEPLEVSLILSCGAEGVVRASTEWVMPGSEVRWRNADPIDGGADAQSIPEALGDLRAHLREARPLATSEQLRGAAMALSAALDILRAEVEEGWERGRRAPATPATRTLIVAHRIAGREDAAWLRAIRRRLSPRIAVGERLLVAAPRYRSFGIEARIAVTAGNRPAAVAESVRATLAARFDAGRRDWPLGRDVSTPVIAGWVRNVEGVARVVSVALTVGGDRVPTLAIGRGELPSLVGDPVVSTEVQPR